jgi:hypothetical protein
MFTIYFDSIPALEDMKECLVKTNQHDILLNSFRITLFSRLLQPGANTAEILDIYISTIKVGLLQPLSIQSFQYMLSFLGF